MRSTSSPGRPRRRARSTAATLITILVVVIGVLLDHDAQNGSVRTVSPAGASAPSLAPSSSGALSEAAPGSLAAVDPSHTVVQAFPGPGSCHARVEGTGNLPDPACTPGAVNPHVTQATIGSTICRRGGYTSSIRPPVNITDREKVASMRAYGDTGSPRGYEFDHLVSLELGGSPNAAANLWPEPGASPNPKDKIETRLHTMVCNHQITLAQAQAEIAGDWVAAYQRDLGGEPARV